MASMKGISPLIATVIIVAMTIIAAIVIFTQILPRQGASADISIVVTGRGSSDGSTATLTVVAHNQGKGAGKMTEVYVIPESAGLSISTAQIVGIGNLTATVATSPPTGLTPGVPAQGFTLAGEERHQFQVYLTGSNLYPGVKIRVFLVYYDLASQQPKTSDYVVTLT